VVLEKIPGKRTDVITEIGGGQGRERAPLGGEFCKEKKTYGEIEQVGGPVIPRRVRIGK